MSSSLRKRKSADIERALRGGAVGIGPQRGHHVLDVDILAAERDNELQQVERPLLRLAGEAHRLRRRERARIRRAREPATGTASSVRRRAAQRAHRARSARARIRSRYHARARDSQARREIRTTAHEHEVAARAVFAEHLRETLPDALDVAGVDSRPRSAEARAAARTSCARTETQARSLRRSPHRAVAIAGRGARLRKPRQEMRHLQRWDMPSSRASATARSACSIAAVR